MRMTSKAMLLSVCKTFTVIGRIYQEMGAYSVSKPQIHVLIAAAGSGTRFDSEDSLPKQYRNLNGQKVIERTINKFKNISNINSVNSIINVKYKDIVCGFELDRIIEGSNSRKNSVYNGIRDLSNLENEDIILIHDAARPLIKEEDVQNLIDALNTHRAATLAVPVSDTLRKGEGETCKDIVSRDGLWAIQTPQAFRYGDILKAHENANDDTEYTDDTSLVSAIGIDVQLVQGSKDNIKITTKDDLKMAEKLLQSQNMIRTGLGYDVHAFDEESEGPIRIGGIDIPHDYKLKGHSDADVALHTITDAILGAIGEGDIGQHFPPSDNTYKDMDSAIFLEKTLEIMEKHNATINNIDLTIICEAPKIGPHAPQMRARIADILNIPENAINIKATTSERLGFTGRKEGIAAQAISTVTIHA